MTLAPGYFEELYASSADPWGLASRWYETRKYAISLALLPSARYADAFEPGCSIGVLTQQLAVRCDRLLSCDAAQAAVAAASARTAALDQVRVEKRVIPQDWPDGSFDLIVFSECLYYFTGEDLHRVLDLGVASLRQGGTMLAVHWRHPVADYPLSGDDVHQALADRDDQGRDSQGYGLARLVQHAEPDFLADVYIRTDGAPVSVAQAGGLA